MAIYALGDLVPEVDDLAFVHPDAVVIGNVKVAAEASIWPNAVLRGDYGRIEIGERSSIQDGSVLHATQDLPTIVGSDCVVGHIVHLEGCRIEDYTLIGSGSIVLHRAVIHSHALVGANAVVTNETIVPSFAMALGVPAKIYLDRVPMGSFSAAVEMYVENAKRYKSQLRRIS